VTPLGHALAYAAPPGRYERRLKPAAVLHPAAELAALGLVVASVAVFGLTLEAPSAAVFCVALVLVTVTDLEYRIVPNRVVFPVSALMFGLNTLRDPSAEWLLAALAVSAVFYVLALVNPGGLGLGDVKLAFMIGAALGWAAVPGLVLGIFAAFLPALAMLLAGRGRKSTLPFAPFLALGALVALFA
jgi:prepilin signal peptidase PulO-like enzyme (type II secretory pathway)